MAENKEQLNNSKTDDQKFYTGLNIVHLACIFDQQQAIDFLSMYGVSKIRQGLQGGTDPVHTAAWFGNCWTSAITQKVRPQSSG